MTINKRNLKFLITTSMANVFTLVFSSILANAMNPPFNPRVGGVSSSRVDYGLFSGGKNNPELISRVNSSSGGPIIGPSDRISYLKFRGVGSVLKGFNYKGYFTPGPNNGGGGLPYITGYYKK